jgi:ArsR family transcriptional regulator
MVVDAEVQSNMERVHRERARSSKDFFKKNFDKFQEKQGLICETSQYLHAVEALMDFIPKEYRKSALEVGPGQGDIIKILVTKFKDTTAIDDSSEMLELSKQSLGSLKSRLGFVQGNFEQHQFETPFDLVVLNMVMHHMPSPQSLFSRLSNLLKPGGYALIADLCEHGQDWAKANCGDLWLGFEPSELDYWAEAASLSLVEKIFIGLKNGFQVQVKLYKT